GVLPVAGKAVPIRRAAVAAVEGAVAAEQAAVDRALGNRVGGRPLAVIRHRRQDEAVNLIAAAVARDGVEPLERVRTDPWAIVRAAVEGKQEMAGADLRRGGGERASIALTAGLDADERAIERRDVAGARGTGSREVALLGEVRALRVLHTRHQ